jgi:hypothetical protein
MWCIARSRRTVPFFLKENKPRRFCSPGLGAGAYRVREKADGPNLPVRTIRFIVLPYSRRELTKCLWNQTPVLAHFEKPQGNGVSG